MQGKLENHNTANNIINNNGGNILQGTARNDEICGQGENDKILDYGGQ